MGAVQALPPAALLRLIDRIGLEDAGELVALATVDQLRRVFEEDLWRSDRPGEDERFDAERFTLWLEVMLEAGERFAADKLAELPEELVELALHHHILVISLQELALLISEGEGQVPLEKVVEDSPYLEFGDYCVIGRRAESWEAITTVLTALDERHSNALQPMLERLWRVTSDYVYGQGGLWEVLTSEEMLQADAAADREDNRARSGFVATSSARSFLALARADDVATLLQAPKRDPVTGAFFREYEATPLGGRQPRAGRPAPSRARGPTGLLAAARRGGGRRAGDAAPPVGQGGAAGRANAARPAPSSSSPPATATATPSGSASSATSPTCCSPASARGANGCAPSTPPRPRSRSAASASSAHSPTPAPGQTDARAPARRRHRAPRSTSSGWAATCCSAWAGVCCTTRCRAPPPPPSSAWRRGSRAPPTRRAPALSTASQRPPAPH